MRRAFYKFHSYLNLVCINILCWGISALFPDASYHFKPVSNATNLSNYSNAGVYTPTGCGDTSKKTTCTLPYQLNADVDAPYWTWSTGEKTSSISVSTAGIYWWETADMSQNKVTNGDFTSDKSGFSSDYGYLTPNGSGTLYPEGKYTITTNPHSVHDGYDSFADHTGSSSNPRNMMVVNGDTVKDKIVWSENITVAKNTSYVFSIWCASANAGNPAQLSFTIGTTTYPLFVLSSTTGLWQNFTIPTAWNSGNSTTATISIINKNTIASGNDFALDDIVFAPVCRKYFNVVYDPTPSQPTITPR